MGRNTKAKASGSATARPATARAQGNQATQGDATPAMIGMAPAAHPLPAAPAIDTPRPRRRRKPFVL
jgi:hypothetical protein